MQELPSPNGRLRERPRTILAFGHKVDMSLPSPVQAMHVPSFVGLSEPGGPFSNLFLSELCSFQVCICRVPHRAGQTSECLPLAFPLLNIELGLERRTLFEVKLVWKRVPQCTGDTRLVLEERFLKPGGRTGDSGGTVDNDGRLEERPWTRSGGPHC